MSIVKLNPEVRKKIEAELKVKIPTPDEEAFEAFLESLQQSHPELHRELLSSLDVTKLPAEKEATKAARRTRLKNFLDVLFFLTKWPGNRVLDKKRVVYAGLGTLAVLLPLAYLVSSGYLQLDQGENRQPKEQVDLSGNNDTLGGIRYNSVGEPDNSTENMATWLFSDSEATPEPADSPQTESDAPSRTFSLFPDIPSTPAPPRSPSAARLPSKLPPGQPNAPNAAPLPTQLSVVSSPSHPQQIIVWQQSSASGPSGSLEPPTTLKAANHPSQQSQAIAIFEREKQLLPLTVDGALNNGSSEEVDNSATAAKQTSGLSVFARATSEEQSLSVSVVPNSRNGTAEDLSDDFPPHLQVYSSKPTLSKPPGEPRIPDEQDRSKDSQTSAEALFQPGLRIPATLVIGIRIAEAMTIPVVAETKGQWCSETNCPNITWLGTARLTASDRIELHFTEAVIDTTPRTVSAVALGSDEVMGLPTTIQMAAVNVARDLLQSAAGGVSDYLEALVNQKKITFREGTVIQEGQVPGIETFILGRFAELISPPSSPTEQVKIASVPAGTTFTILYGVNPSN